jgi:hypothetical protein
MLSAKSLAGPPINNTMARNMVINNAIFAI